MNNTEILKHDTEFSQNISNCAKKLYLPMGAFQLEINIYK